MIGYDAMLSWIEKSGLSPFVIISHCIKGFSKLDHGLFTDFLLNLMYLLSL